VAGFDQNDRPACGRIRTHIPNSARWHLPIAAAPRTPQRPAGAAYDGITNSVSGCGAGSDRQISEHASRFGEAIAKPRVARRNRMSAAQAAAVLSQRGKVAPILDHRIIFFY
jgi:hypothetical protein